MRTTICLLLSIISVGCNTTIKVYNENLNETTVNQAFSMWEVEWQSVEQASQADLVIKKVYPQQMHCPTNVGEFYFGRGLILVNKNFYKKASNKDKINLIAHEIGHFFYIDHTDTQNALMNQKSQLSSRKITHHEVKSFKKNRYKFLTCLYFCRLIKNFTKLN